MSLIDWNIFLLAELPIKVDITVTNQWILGHPDPPSRAERVIFHAPLC